MIIQSEQNEEHDTRHLKAQARNHDIHIYPVTGSPLFLMAMLTIPTPDTRSLKLMISQGMQDWPNDKRA
jgi:hypothetical protein